MNKVIIGLGNTGSVIVREVAKKNLNDVMLFAIDSQTRHVSLDDVASIKYIPIIADDNDGSGRDRERGRDMFLWNSNNGKLDEMYEICKETDTIFVVTSAAGGTGSGSCPALCKQLRTRNEYCNIIPIIICPNMDDPDAYHLNTTDLMVELGEVGIKTYMIFRNPNSSDYRKVNAEIVEAIDILLGNKYETTDNDSIDASDLNNILMVDGRLFAISVSGDSVDEVSRKLAKEIVSSYQPIWDPSDRGYGVAAFSMKSINAGEDSKVVFDDILPKIEHCSDRYKNIVIDDNNGKIDVSLIVAGLQPVDFKTIEVNYTETASISENLKKAERPAFMTNRKRRSFAEFKRDMDKK